MTNKIDFNFGFTLIEILIVITIISILSSIAIPAYKNYVTKAKLIELHSIGSAYQIQVTEILARGESPNLKPEITTKYISAVDIFTNKDKNQDKYIIQITGNKSTLGLDHVLGKIIMQFVAEQKSGIMLWSCHVSENVSSFIPGCINNIIG